MKVARSLSSGEVILLTSIYRVATGEKFDTTQHFGLHDWIQKMARVSGLKYGGLIELHEQNLIDKKLITPRMLPDKSGIQINPHFRLSDLGYNFCSFIEAYRENDT
jgi:hypothetical protein